MSKKFTRSRLPVYTNGPRSVSNASRRTVTPALSSEASLPRNDSKAMSEPNSSDATATTWRKPLQPPVRRSSTQLALSAPIRKTPSMCSLPTDDTNALKELVISNNEKASGDKVKCKFPMHKPRMNLVTQQRLDMARMPKMHLQAVFTFGPSLKKMPTYQTAITQQENTHGRVIEPSRLRTFESMYRKLEDMQSNFFKRLRSMGPNELSHSSERYKFLSLVTNNGMKVILHEDDLFRLPKCLPTESVNDLKDRCAAIVEAGFALLFEAVPQIQLATSEVQSLNFREDLRKKLQSLMNRKLMEMSVEIHELCKSQRKSGTPDMARLYQQISELRVQKKQIEAKYFDCKRDHADQLSLMQIKSHSMLKVEINKFENKIAELTRSMTRLEAQISSQDDRLAEKNAGLQDMEQTQTQLLNELSKQKLVNTDLMKHLSSANEHLRGFIQNGTGRVAYLEAELEQAYELISSLHRQPDAMDRGIYRIQRVTSDLQTHIKNLEAHKEWLNNQVGNMLEWKQVHDELQSKYEEAFSRIDVLQTEIAEKEAIIAEYSTVKQNLQHQLAHSREENHKIKKEMLCLQEAAQRDGQLLSIRSEIITSLELHGQDTHRDMEETFKQMKNELDLKDVAFLDILKKLTTKQSESHRQEHIIKLLEERNRRNAELNALQEKKIEEKLAEISQLKRTISSYTNMMTNDSDEQQPFEHVPDAELATQQFNESNQLLNNFCTDLYCPYHFPAVTYQQPYQQPSSSTNTGSHSQAFLPLQSTQQQDFHLDISPSQQQNQQFIQHSFGHQTNDGRPYYN